MRILGIETSCDETGVAIYCSEQGLIAHKVYSQTAIHAQYGGVVPELASRDHIRKLLPLIKTVLAESQLKNTDINGIAYTAGPGLAGALLVGAAVARSLGFAWQIPTIGLHHMEGHLLAPLLEAEKPEFPFIALLVSGGHTLLVHVHAIGEYELLGESVDDAVGEAFDKTAKLLGLTYPGGAALANLAEQGNPERFIFPKPMTDRPGLNFSFSGLKTYAVNTVREFGNDDQTRADIACAFQMAVIETLIIKCERAIKQTGLRRLVVAGGVSANQRLRQELCLLLQKHAGKAYFPRLEFCGDNGAMIAYAGYLRLKAGCADNLTITVRPRWPMSELTPP